MNLFKVVEKRFLEHGLAIDVEISKEHFVLKYSGTRFVAQSAEAYKADYSNLLCGSVWDEYSLYYNNELIEGVHIDLSHCGFYLNCTRKNSPHPEIRVLGRETHGQKSSDGMYPIGLNLTPDTRCALLRELDAGNTIEAINTDDFYADAIVHMQSVIVGVLGIDTPGEVKTRVEDGLVYANIRSAGWKVWGKLKMTSVPQIKSNTEIAEMTHEVILDLVSVAMDSGITVRSLANKLELAEHYVSEMGSSTTDAIINVEATYNLLEALSETNYSDSSYVDNQRDLIYGESDEENN